MTTNKALVSTVATIAAAVIAVAVDLGLNIGQRATQDILTLITVVTPAVLGVIAWAHHSHAKVVVAQTTGVSTPHP